MQQLSVYLDVADAPSLPQGWSRQAHFSLTVLNHKDTTKNVIKDADHNFNVRAQDWGFREFVQLADLATRAPASSTTTSCRSSRASASSRRSTGGTGTRRRRRGTSGLKNQGATCYMNSLLQTLMHIPYFCRHAAAARRRRRRRRRAPPSLQPHRAPSPSRHTTESTQEENPEESIPLALQRIFYKLQYSDTSVSTKELTKSFGWDTYDTFMQHDVQELNRVLVDKLEEKMKGTSVEGTMAHLFRGKFTNYVKCINVEDVSLRDEDFYDLQMPVKGCKDLYASLRRVRQGGGARRRQPVPEHELRQAGRQEGRAVQGAAARARAPPPPLRVRLRDGRDGEDQRALRVPDGRSTSTATTASTSPRRPTRRRQPLPPPLGPRALGRPQRRPLLRVHPPAGLERVVPLRRRARDQGEGEGGPRGPVRRRRAPDAARGTRRSGSSRRSRTRTCSCTCASRRSPRSTSTSRQDDVAAPLRHALEIEQEEKARKKKERHGGAPVHRGARRHPKDLARRSAATASSTSSITRRSRQRCASRRRTRCSSSSSRRSGGRPARAPQQRLWVWAKPGRTTLEFRRSSPGRSRSTTTTTWR